MLAISRLLAPVGEGGGAAAVHDRLVEEARRLFGADHAVLLWLPGTEGRAEVVAADPHGEAPFDLLPVALLPPVAAVVEREAGVLRIGGRDAAGLGGSLGLEGVESALILPLRAPHATTHVLVLTDPPPAGEELEVVGAFAAAASAALEQLGLARERAGEAARHAALARAAKTLNESLERGKVLLRICAEAVRILAADNATVCTGDANSGLRVEAAYGHSAGVIGTRLAAGEGLAGEAVRRGEPMLTNDHPGLPLQPEAPELRAVRSGLAVPMRWDGALHGVLTVGYARPHVVTREHLALLETFAELAAAACRNASAHQGLALAARTDSLTGCLNHGALHEALRRELDRCRRGGQGLSLALLDLDDFKQVNERHGHLVGDEVLRRAGQALRRAVRSYDVAGRYGGDEFALVALDAGEEEATRLAGRAIDELERAIGPLAEAGVRAGRATAGVAEWDGDEPATELIARADRALLYAKQRGDRGAAMAAASVPAGFEPAGGGQAPART
jgi:diguanylate cyclase (GGDEF)-like protein